MSWITRCPDCDTVYKVASEQLQQAHGWLRCGTCQHVFDSAGRVVAADVIPTLIDRVNVGAPQIGRVDLDRLLHKESPAPVMPLPATDSAVTQAAAEPVAQTEPPVEPSPISAFEDALQSFKWPDLSALPPGDGRAGLSSETLEPAAASATVAAPRKTSKALVAVLMLLLAGLVFQALLAGRPTVLAHWPQVGAWASQWCSSAPCRAPWQPPLSLWSLKAQPLALDGSGYRLEWSLAHSADGPLPVPDLALQLFNAQGQAVSSQRLTAAITAAPTSLAAGQVWQSTLHVELAADVDASRAELRLVPR